MKIKYIISIFLLGLLLSACAGSRVSVLAENFHPKEKKIVLLSGESTLKKLRIELLKKGFKVPRYSALPTSVSRTKQTEEGEVTITEAFYGTDASYGIEVTDVKLIDWCLFSSSSQKLDITLEIIDLQNNEVVAYVSQKGWSAPCLNSGDLYKKLAEQIEALWKGKFAHEYIGYDEDYAEEY